VSILDGVLIVDKPTGPTSHDVVAVARRAARHWRRDDRRSPIKIGHTGTLDPLASGVLPLVLGRATRLAQFLSGADKEYDADICLGISTTTYDRAGEIVDRPPARAVSDVTRSDIEAALSRFRGAHMQQPPQFSAKKVDGDRAYDLARRRAPVSLRPAGVVVSALEIVDWDGPRLRLRLVCSAGFYVRSLAHAIGEALDTGAHLSALVRTRSGDFPLSSALPLAELDRHPDRAALKIVRLDDLLPAIPAVTLTEKGAALAAKGGFIAPVHLAAAQEAPAAGKVRLLHPDGHLVAIAEPRAGGPSVLLHPGIVLE
jgi:tRNA pseudouridine55 synthase